MEANDSMKIIFLGATTYSLELLNAMIDQGFKPGMIFGIPERFNISYDQNEVKNYNYANLEEKARQEGIMYHKVNGESGNKLEDFHDSIRSYKPDVILVLGWYYKVSRKIRELARFGAWGIHASLLPDYAGGAPLVWAIINGEKETGVTLFQLDEGMDSGDIIDQECFSIGTEDSIKLVYQKATEVSKTILFKALRNITHLAPRKQDLSRRHIFPQRNPEDGEIDLSWPAERIFNFIRAQSPPYPGAFIRTIDGGRIIIEKAKLGHEI